MAISKIRALQTSIRSFKSTVDSERGDTGATVSQALAAHYNSLREKAAGFADLSEHLPPVISLKSMFDEMGFTDAQFADLRVYLNQLVSLVDLLEDENAT